MWILLMETECSIRGGKFPFQLIRMIRVIMNEVGA
jgi:hypothetical protein